MRKTLMIKKARYLAGYWWLGIMLVYFLTGSPAFATQNYNADSEDKVATQAESQKGRKKDKQNAPVMTFKDGKLTVNMPSTTLSQAMKEFSCVTGIKILWQGTEPTRPVTLVFNDRTVNEAVRYMLDGENYMLLFSSRDREEMIDRILILPNGNKNDNTASFARSSAGMNMFIKDEIEEMKTPDLNEMDMFKENEMEEMMTLENEMDELKRTQYSQ